MYPIKHVSKTHNYINKNINAQINILRNIRKEIDINLQAETHNKKLYGDTLKKYSDLEKHYIEDNKAHKIQLIKQQELQKKSNYENQKKKTVSKVYTVQKRTRRT